MPKLMIVALPVVVSLVLFFPVRGRTQGGGAIASLRVEAGMLVNDCSPAGRLDASQTVPPNDLPALSFCFGYIGGVVDMRNGLNALSPGANNPYCVPESVSMLDLAKIVLKYGNTHPEALNQSGLILVTYAYIQSFPCR